MPTQITTVSSAISKNTAQQISRDVFGLHVKIKPTQSDARTAFVGDGLFESVLAVKRQHVRMLDYGLLAYLVAVRTAARGQMALKCMRAIVLSTIDDANMWVRMGSEAVVRQKMCRDGIVRQVKQSPNKHIPALNVVQNILSTGRPDDGAHALSKHRMFHVPTPTQPMPRANWMTVFYSYNRWSMYTGGQCGAKWHGDPSIGEAIELVPLVAGVLLKDALGLNECIVAETQRRLDASYSAEKVRLLLDLTCMGHKTALSCRQAYSSVPRWRTIHAARASFRIEQEIS